VYRTVLLLLCRVSYKKLIVFGIIFVKINLSGNAIHLLLLYSSNIEMRDLRFYLKKTCNIKIS